MRAEVLDDERGIVPAVLTAAHNVNGPAHGDVAQLAYSYWEARGGQGGSPWEDWFRAERELKRGHHS